MMQIKRVCVAALPLVLAACGSTPNRKPVGPAALPSRSAGVAEAADAAGPADASSGVGAGDAAASGDPAAAEQRQDLATPIGSEPPAAGKPPVASASGGPKLGGDLLGTVAGQPLYASELLQAWLQRDSREVSRYLDKLVLDRLVVAESKRLGIVLSKESVREAIAQAQDLLKETIAENGGGSVEDFIRSRMGLDPALYMQRMEASKVTDLLASRCVRSFLLENERAAARMIVVQSREAADLVQAGMARGQDFASLAKEHSADPSAKDGGRIPDLVRSQSAISRLAFTTEVGEVGGPLMEGGRWIFLRVDGREPARSGGWEAFGAEVEATLAERPIDDLEFLQWQASVSSRYEVDTTPFLELVGEPVSNP